MLGYIGDNEAFGVRPIAGLPGAAWIGPPLVLPPADAVWFAPAQSYALALSRGDGRVLIADFRALAVSEYGAVPPKPANIVFSPGGSAAALYYAESRQVAILSALPAKPSASSPVSLAAAASLLAISDDGQLLLAALDDGTISALSSAGDVRFALPGQPAAMSFFPQSHDAVIADLAAAQIIGVPEQGDVVRVADLPASFAAVATSWDRRIILASKNGSVRLLGPDGGALSESVCPCTPVRVEQLRQTGVYLLTAFRRGSPLWLLDVRGDSPALVFVPAAGGKQ